MGYTPWGHNVSNTTEHARFFFNVEFLFFFNLFIYFNWRLITHLKITYCLWKACSSLSWSFLVSEPSNQPGADL